eukprot:scaffold647885_cov41-Prasinocladus_malaysianus.AAC.1
MHAQAQTYFYQAVVISLEMNGCFKAWIGSGCWTQGLGTLAQTRSGREGCSVLPNPSTDRALFWLMPADVAVDPGRRPPAEPEKGALFGVFGLLLF